MDKKSLISSIEEFTKPLAQELGYELYHIEYTKENGEYYLRIYIDKEGGISLDDCEALSRKVNPILDEKDPIDAQYYLEVSSPGLNRGLYTDEQFKRYIGREILVKLSSSINNTKTIKGKLKDITSDSIIVTSESDITIQKDKIKSANLDDDI